jgi:translocation and assembly module TamB
MRRILKWIVWSIVVLAALPATLVLVVLAGGNTAPGQALIARLAPRLTGGLVSIDGLSGRFPDRLRAAQLSLHDRDGVWATIDDLELDWSPLRLVSSEIAIHRIAATRIVVRRRPVSSASSSSSARLALDIDDLHVARLDIAPPVTGTDAASLALDGSAAISATGQGHITLAAKGVEAAGNYHLDAQLDPAALHIRLRGREPSHGFVAKLAGLPDLGPLSVAAALSGPRTAAEARLVLVAGALRAAAKGTVDLDHQAADLAVAATAPAMSPRPDLSWQSVALEAKIDGPFVRPEVSGTLDVDALKAAGADAARIAAKVTGNSGTVRLQATVAGIRVPGPQPLLLAATPVELAAQLRLDRPNRPLRFSLAHPLITADGDATTSGNLAGKLKLRLSNLAPLAAVAHLDLQGHAVLNLTAAMKDGTTRLDADGTLGITGGTVPAPALIGDAAHLTMSAKATGSKVTVSRLEIAGRKITASASGSLGPDKLAVDWRLLLPDLTSALPTLTGAVEAGGQVSGPSDDLAATADLSGTLGPVDKSAGPISAIVQLQGLPGKPSGHITAQGVLVGSPLQLALDATRAGDGALKVTIDRADWKSAHAQGALTLAAGARFPLGRLDLRMARLDDLQPLIGQPITGALTAGVVANETGGHQQADLHLEMHNVGLRGAASTGHVEMTATIVDPLTRPLLNTRIVAGGKLASGVATSAEIELRGPENAIGLRVAAAVREPGSGDVRLATTGTVNAVTRVAALAALQATWKGEDLRLLGPARVGFGNGIVLDHLRLGLGQGIIEANGRVSPALDLTVAMRNLSADLAAVFAPGLAVDGVLRGDARLTGTPQRPAGRIELAATGLRLRTGPGQALPAANVTASADLAGLGVHVEARLTAGPKASLSVSGRLATAPSAPVDLHATGAIDLAMLNPLLSANGRHAAGQITLDGRVTGTAHAPRVRGAARLANAAIEDFPLGLHITDITGLIEADGDTLKLTQLQGRAGPGTIGVGGSVDMAAPGLPLNLQITARNARPLASDLLTAELNADMRVSGEAIGKLTVGGKIDVLHAAVGIPKSMPAQVPVLNVRVAGQPAPPPVAPPPAIGLDLTVAAQHIVLRGRGLFAELGGSVAVSGNTAAPQPLGSFRMIRGTLSLAGETLSFDKGEIGFNGGSLTDPSLDFVATGSSSAMTASLIITGTASHPKVTLTSTPEMPQDQVLAQLLFGTSGASISAVQMAEVASSLAELSGATSGGDMFGGLRSQLGLEQLGVGTAANGSAALQAGRYVAPGVYVGAQQGVGGNGSQVKVEVDIKKGLKVFGTVGNGTNAAPGATPAQSAGTSLGVEYQFQY